MKNMRKKNVVTTSQNIKRIHSVKEKRSFSERCYDILRTVPKGKVVTYADLAHALGCRAYRAVGHAMARNPYIPEVPCHRVVRSDGDLGGYMGGIEKKKKLLAQEGVLVQNGKVDLEKYGYEFDI